MLGEEVEKDETDFVGDEKNFFYQKWYDADSARFVNPPPECFYGNNNEECHSCVRTLAKEKVKMNIYSIS